jgi:hypothetical protein
MKNVDTEYIKEIFRSFLKNFKGIQKFAIIFESNNTCYFSVDIFEKYYESNKKIFPKTFKDIPIKINKIISAELL